LRKKSAKDPVRFGLFDGSTALPDASAAVDEVSPASGNFLLMGLEDGVLT